MSSMWIWLKERWKIVLGSILGLLGVLSVYLRLKNQKEVLQKANEAHEKDNRINNQAIESLTEGMSEIDSETSEKIASARKSHDAVEKEINSEKEAFVEEAAKDEDLGKKIADELGLKYVEKN